jgi:hypothetical protein
MYQKFVTMQRTDYPTKRSNYPFTAMLILLVHLGLGYYIYQHVTQPNTSTNGTELKAINQQDTPAIP